MLLLRANSIYGNNEAPSCVALEVHLLLLYHPAPVSKVNKLPFPSKLLPALQVQILLRIEVLKPVAAFPQWPHLHPKSEAALVADQLSNLVYA